MIWETVATWEKSGTVKLEQVLWSDDRSRVVSMRTVVKPAAAVRPTAGKVREPRKSDAGEATGSR